ncbi:MAG: adenosylmethionine--8-amino-7-oxononanoate transaminase [Sulfuriferula sp.]
MKNSYWLTRSRESVWHPCTQMKQLEDYPPVPIARGEGVWLYDFDDKRYLDAVSSWWVNLFGHCNPRINAALRDQLEQIEHVMLAGFTHAPVVELSERLARLTGLGHAFYGSDGASAVEIALKMSFHYWRNVGQPDKTEFVSLQNSYHGETLGALSVTDVALFKDTYAPLLRHSVQVPSPDWRLAEAGETSEQYALRAAESLENHLAKHHATTAALIVEPLIQGAAGMGMYHPAYLKRARAICDSYGVHLIADEIAVGFGRTGTMFACEQAGIRPDFICLSKGITGGYLPLSAVLTTDPIYAAFYDDATARGFLHSHSYTGNPLACRAALATLDIFEQDDVLEANRNKTAYGNRAAEPLRNHPRVRNFRNAGMIWAFEVGDAAPGFARRLYHLGLEAGLLLRPIGNTVYFMPPYVITEAEISWMMEISYKLIDAV